MSCVGRHIRGVLDTYAVECFVIGINVAGVFTAAAAGEHDLDLLPETGRVVDIVRGDSRVSLSLWQIYDLKDYSLPQRCPWTSMIMENS